MSSGGVVGFDFGNLNCVICQAKRGGIDTVLNENSKRKSSCYVSFQGKQRFMGAAAVPLAKSNYKNTVTQVKRLLGRKFSDPDVQEDIKRMPYPEAFKQLDGDNIGIEVMYNDEKAVFTPEEITGMMLTCLRKTVASASDGAQATDIVVSVPGYWTDVQRRAMQDACSIAGFKALRLLNDHTATALAYGIFKSARNMFDTEKKQYVMFIDIGHADTSVAVVSFIQGKLQVVCAEYDSKLGGRDFDRCIMERMADEFKEKHGLDPRTNPKAVIKLFAQCEKAKQTLTPEGVGYAKVNVEYLMNEIDFSTELKLDDMDNMVAPLLARLVIPVKKCLEKSKLSTEDLSAIEIVGGGSRPRCVKKAIAEALNLDTSLPNYGLSTTLNADECVARGCALNSAILSPQFRVKEFLVSDVVSYPIKLTWDEKDIDTSKMDVDEGEEEESTVGKNSIVIMLENDETPKTRRVTFRRREAFDIVASYADEAKLPEAASKEIATFKVSVPSNAKETEEAPKIRVNFRHNLNGVFEMLSAQYLEEVPPKEEKAETGEKAGKDDDAKKDAKADEKKGEEPEKKEPAKKTYKRIELSLNSEYKGGLSSSDVDSFKQREVKFAEADRVLEETAAVRNQLEEYIYKYRDRVIGALRDYTTEEERQAFSSALEKEESWLYDEGFDETLEEYSKHLSVLKESGDRYETRYKEQQERPQAHRELTKAVDDYLQVVNSSDEKYSHLSDEEREKVRSACKEATSWLDKQSAGQEKLPQASDPVLTSGMILAELQKLRSVSLPVVTKKKPPPPKPKAEEKKEKEPASEEAKAEEKKTDEPMPDADTKEKSAEDNQDGENMDTSLD
mmetsp:Transcript_6222/g.7150  ORF Transcript_6222/g.7150 Transcript_6222/m.7150 type:complete len:844 (-) Transcript_6222:114-2645(-)